MATIPSVQLFRNSLIITGRTEAIKALDGQKASVPDGGLILARYSDDGTDNGVKTLLGIVRNGGGTNVQLTVIDVEGAAKNVQEAITSAINKLNKADAEEEGQYVASVSEDKGIITVTRKPLPSFDEKTASGKAITAITQTKGEVSVKFGGVAAANVSVADTSDKFTATNVEDTLLEIKTSLDNAIGTGGSVAEQITNAINDLNSEKSGTSNHITVGVGQVAGKITSVTVSDSDIASAELLGTTSDTQDKATAFGRIAQEAADRTAAIEALGLTQVGGDGKVIATISQSNGQVSASAIDLTASNVKATASTGSTSAVAVDGNTVSAQIASLATSIKSVESGKTYTISAVTSSEANVKEAFALVDGSGTQAGATIKIYKDSSLKSVALNGQMLNFTYILADGSESTVGVDVSTFLAESEFKDGLEVVDGIVKVKKDANSEKFLSVSESGVKLDGVQAAINTAAAAATTKVEKTGEGSHITVASSKSNSDSSVTYTISESDIASANALTAETNARESADTALSDRLGNGVTSSLTATAQFAELSNKLGTGITTVATVTEQLKALSGSSTSDTSDTISVIGAKKYTDAKVEALDLTQVGGADKVITTISQADGKVSASAIDLTASNVKANASSSSATAVAVDGATVEAQIASLAQSIKSVSTTAAAAHTVVTPKDNGGHVTVTVAKSNDGSHDVVTITENDIASASALETETNARVAQDDTIEAAVGLNADGNHVKTNGHYTKDATTVVGEIEALDTKLKEVSDTLGTGVSIAEGKTVTEQLQALSGRTGDASGVTSVEGAKAYAKDLVDNLKAEVGSTTGTSKTEAIKIVQAHGKIDSITLGAFDCGTY